MHAGCKTFLVPTDFSSVAKKAAAQASLPAESFGARIYFLYVLDIYPLIAYSYCDEIFGPIPQLTPEDVEPDWSAFPGEPKLDKICWEKWNIEGRAADITTASSLNARSEFDFYRYARSHRTGAHAVRQRGGKSGAHRAVSGPFGQT